VEGPQRLSELDSWCSRGWLGRLVVPQRRKTTVDLVRPTGAVGQRLDYGRVPCAQVSPTESSRLRAVSPRSPRVEVDTFATTPTVGRSTSVL